MKLYGGVGTFLLLTEEREYEPNSGSPNLRYLVAGRDEVAGGDYVDDGRVASENSESWWACGTTVGGRVKQSYLNGGGSYDDGDQKDTLFFWLHRIDGEGPIYFAFTKSSILKHDGSIKSRRWR
jgi:hypothetical protein